MLSKTNFAFLGTPEFAAIILEEIIKAGMTPALVVCNPDKPVGKKKIITAPPTKIIAQKYNIPVWQPEKIETEEFRNKFKKIDFALIAAYSKILPKEIIYAPRKGALVIHPSLLPRHRGATPIQNAILAGDEITGATLILADEKVDHGPIIAGKELEIKKDENYESLMERLAKLSSELILKTIPDWLADKIKLQTQNENYATCTKKFKTEDGFVDLEKESAETIMRKIRALNPEPGVWTIQNDKRTKILEAKLIDGKLKITKIQTEGKKPQSVNSICEVV